MFNDTVNGGIRSPWVYVGMILGDGARGMKREGGTGKGKTEINSFVFAFV